MCGMTAAKGTDPLPQPGRPIASVVIPAHNEEPTIGRLLTTLLAGAAPGEFEVVVACNGCTDRTADVVREQFPGVIVAETPVGSKPGALDLGDATATVWPRFYVDADVLLSSEALRTVATEMKRTGVLAAAPRLELELAGRPWAVRAYYETWMDGPYLTDGHIGSGVYALAEAGRARFGDWPRLLSEDLWLRDLFSRSERLTVTSVSFRQHPPYTLSDVITIKARMKAGNVQYRTAYPELADRPDAVHAKRSVSAFLRKPASWPGMVIYAGVTVISRRKAQEKIDRQELDVWERAESSRREPTT
jgi:hypothetical protein